MIDLGERIKFIPLLLEGVIKVVREDDSGEELLLYFVEFGSTCAMTLNCCLENTSSEIRAICDGGAVHENGGDCEGGAHRKCASGAWHVADGTGRL